MTEVQPTTAEATVPLSAGGSLPLPYAYRIDRPSDRPESAFMLSYGKWNTAPGPITTVHHAATHAAAQARQMHQYWGPMTVWVWAHRGEEEHYRNDPPATAYRLDLTGVPPKPERRPLHSPVYMACAACHGPKEETPGRPGAGTPEGSG